MKVQPFHLAIPVSDLEKARRFYKNILGCGEGRSSEHWVDFNFFGHQLVIHQKPKEEGSKSQNNPVDGKTVPIPHFGVVLEWDVFHEFASLLKAKKIQFEIDPHIRFEGEVGEQATMFFNDPCGNALEFKAFKDKNQLFAK